jgi:opacity protein-like surface antigen
MKLILTAAILLAATAAFAEDTPQPVVPATNSLVNTNETTGYKPGKAWSKADASTGATRSKAKKQK